MKNFKASEAVYLCDECGDELKVVDSEYEQEPYKGWWLEVDCRECGPQGREWLPDL